MIANVYGAVPPEAGKVCEYATPTVPAGGLPQVIDSGGAAPVVKNEFVRLVYFRFPIAEKKFVGSS